MADPAKLLELFLASTIHEAKNHLGHLNHTLEDLCLPETPEPSPSTSTEIAPTTLQTAKDQIHFLNHLLTQVLVHYRGMQMGYQLHTDQVDLEDFLEDINNRHRHSLSMRGVRLSTELQDDAFGFFDEQLIHHVLDTLIANAVSAGATDLNLIVTRDETHTTLIQLADNGPGLSESLINDRVNHLQDAQAEDHKTGLGLYLAQQILQAHQHNDKCGTLILRNRTDGTGALITLKLP